MILKWNDVMVFFSRPVVFLLGNRLEDTIIIELTRSEHEKLLDVLSEKILPNAKLTSNGRLFIDNKLLSNEELSFLSHIFEDHMTLENSPELLNNEILEKTWFIGATIELTTYCNFRCPHCLIPIWRRISKKCIPAETVIKTIKRLNKRGLMQIAFTGGEPTFYPHNKFKEIIGVLNDSTIIFLNTNAYNFSEDLVKELAERGVLIKVSLYGLDERSYKIVTGVPDAFQRVKKSLDMLRKYDAKLKIQVTYMSVHEKLGINPDDMLKFALEYTSVVTIVSSYLPGWGGREGVNLIASSSMIKNFEKYERGEYFLSFKYIKPMSLPDYNCALSKGIDVYITAEGLTLACPFMDELISHIKNPIWPAIHYLKITSRRVNPWRGGRCGILYESGIWKSRNINISK